MMPVKESNSGVVTTIADDDLVMCHKGQWSPIKFADFMKTVRGGIQVGGRNLLLNSAPNHTTDAYLVLPFAYAEDLNPGEQFTLTIYGELGQGKERFLAINGGGDASHGNCSLAKVADGVYRGIFTYINHAASRRLCVYAFPNTVSVNSTINRIKLERGNIATDWTPAPEDIASGACGGG